MNIEMFFSCQTAWLFFFYGTRVWSSQHVLLCRAGSLSLWIPHIFPSSQSGDGILQTARFFPSSHNMCSFDIKVPFCTLLSVFLGLVSDPGRLRQTVSACRFDHVTNLMMRMMVKFGWIREQCLSNFFLNQNIKVYWRNETIESISIPHPKLKLFPSCHRRNEWSSRNRAISV